MPQIILVVEDYPDARTLMKFLLEDYGYGVLEAGNGQEAVEIVDMTPPDLILMDLSMPIMDGITATKIIRESESNSHIPIIAVTAHGNTLYNEAIEAGCNGLLPKPVDFASLKPVIKKHLPA
jgi:CheY-like chemotaxis protein